jgi:hypothetical protein
MMGGDMVDEGGGERGGGECLRCKLSPPAQSTLRRIFDGIVPEEVVDYHVHLVGHGDSGSGCYLHDSTKTWRYPLRRIKTAVFMAAAQSPDMEGGDLQYISRLIRLARHFVPAAVLDPTRSGYRSGTLCLLAFDKFYEKNGSPDRNKTTMVRGMVHNPVFSCASLPSLLPPYPHFFLFLSLFSPSPPQPPHTVYITVHPQ